MKRFSSLLNALETVNQAEINMSSKTVCFMICSNTPCIPI